MGYTRIVDLHGMAGHLPSFDEICQDPDHPSAIRALWVMTLLLAIKDRASEVLYEPGRGEDRLRYRVSGGIHPLVPPPLYPTSLLIRELTRLIRSDNPGSRLARLFERRNQGVDRRPIERIVFLLMIQDALVGGAASIDVSPESPSIVITLFSDGTASLRAWESLSLCMDQIDYPRHEWELNAPGG